MNSDNLWEYTQFTCDDYAALWERIAELRTGGWTFVSVYRQNSKLIVRMRRLRDEAV